MEKFEYLIERISLPYVLLMGVVWITLFTALFYIIPMLDKNSIIIDINGAIVNSLADSAYFSIVTVTTLGYGDLQPKGLIKLFASIEVLGGLIFVGLAVNSILSIPVRRTRKAIKECTGWWVEKTTVENKTFFSFTWMNYDGDKLVKNGVNFDPGGEMHNTTYKGNLLTNSFPLIFSIYQNDRYSSKYYTHGIFKIEMLLDMNGKYTQYEGSCYDSLGMRDRIVGHRYEGDLSINDLQKMNDDQKQEIISQLFRI